MALNEKQKQFCNEYLIDFNGAQAAIRAGYSKKTANRIASRLLSNVDIQAYLKELIENRNERVKITQDEVIRDIIEVKNRCMQKAPVMRFDKEDKKYVQVTDELERDLWQFDASNANKALDMLAKHTGLYEVDNKQKAGFNIVVADEKHKQMLEDL